MQFLRGIMSMLNPQLPLPTFEDWRKMAQFWIDQQDKWFYFETALVPSSSHGTTQNSTATLTSSTFADQWYAQTRIVGKIIDVVTYPPSLRLEEASVFTIEMRFRLSTKRILNTEVRRKYGLVLSQITYYESVDNPKDFIISDSRLRES